MSIISLTKSLTNLDTQLSEIPFQSGTRYAQRIHQALKGNDPAVVEHLVDLVYTRGLAHLLSLGSGHLNVVCQHIGFAMAKTPIIRDRAEIARLKRVFLYQSSVLGGTSPGDGGKLSGFALPQYT